MTTLTAATPTFGGGNMLAGAAPSAPAPIGAGAFTPADVWRIIRQRFLFIVLIGTFFTALFVGGVLVWYLKYPGYVAESYIQVTSLSPPDTMRETGPDPVDNKTVEREIQNQALLVTQPSILDDVLQDPTIRSTVWFREADAKARESNGSIRDMLDDIVSVSPVRDSNLIRVAAKWRIPRELPTLVNTVVNKYWNKINERSRNEIQDQVKGVNNELEIAKGNLDAKNAEIQDFIQASPSDPLGVQIDQQVAELTAHQTEVELQVTQYRTICEVLTSKAPDADPIDAQTLEILKTDPQLQRLDFELQRAKNALDQIGQRFMENHQMYKQAKAAYDAAFQNLESARAQRIVDIQRGRVTEASDRYNRAKKMLVEVTEKLNSAKVKQLDKNRRLARLNSMYEEQSLLTQQYQLIQEKQSRLAIQQRQEKKVRVDIAAPAVEPKRISSPNLVMMLPLSGMLGFGISIGLAFLIDLTDKSVRTPRDISRTQLPVLGTIPTTDDDQIVIDRVETACLDAPHSIVAEAFRSLRANLFFSAPAEQQGVILVTSPSGDNGKTTVASNLAISIALSGRRVLLIDANFRRAALPMVFPNVRAEGLSNILIGQGQLRDYATPTQVPGLDILAAGPIPPNPAELLGSSYLRDVIVDARARYDQVIFDGPPVLLVSDAMVLAGAVDGCLLVCEYRRTSRGALQRSRTNLEAINARIFGAVLNKVEGRRGGYFRKQYREFYEYQEPDEDIGERPRLDISAVAGAAAGADSFTDTTYSDRGYDDYPSGGAAGADVEEVEFEADDDDDIEGLDELEDEPPLADTTQASIAPAAPAETPRNDTAAPSPDVPDVDLGSDLDLGSLPDLSDLDKLDIQADVDIERPPSPRPQAEDAIDSRRSEEEALDLENLADELEELDGEEFNIDDRYDLGDDAAEDDELDDRQ